MLINDVSKYQGTIHWTAFSSVRDAVIMRAHNGWEIDPTFQANRNGAHTTGFKAIGLYQYVTSGKDVATQARQFVGTIGHLQPNEFVMGDFEDPKVTGGLAAALRTWTSIVESAFGGKAVIYTGDYLADSLPPSVTGNRLRALAAYRSAPPSHPYDLWQYTDKARVLGIDDPVDESKTNLTVSQLLSRTRGTAPVTAGKTPAQLAHFGNYDPSSFGWKVFPAADIVPFTWQGVTFPQGVHRLAVPWFTNVLDDLHTRGYLPKPYNPGCWGAEDRNVTGGKTKSFHAYALAIDFNAPDNPFSANGSVIRHDIKDGANAVVRAHGGEWGGGWISPKDYMHIECHLSPHDIGVTTHKPVPEEDFLTSAEAEQALAQLTKDVSYIKLALSVDVEHVSSAKAHVAVPPYSAVNKLNAIAKMVKQIQDSINIADGTAPTPPYSVFNVANHASRDAAAAVAALADVKAQLAEVHAAVVKGETA